MSAAGVVLLPDGRRMSAVLTSTAVARGVTLVEAVVRREDGTAPFLDRHLRARARGARPWPRMADVLTAPGGRGCSRERALRELGRLRQQHPGALVTVLRYGEHRCAVRLGSGAVLLLAPAPGAPVRALLPSSAVASLLHAWLAAGIPPDALAGAVIETLRLPSSTGPSSTARPPSSADGRRAVGGLRARLLRCPRPGQDGSPTRARPARSESGG